ncbi:uncharacterized protein Z520_08841 [Fonsecaea multimorphosa CBS 102226]|uniref:Tautomerase cis-CaaD-like domain-containing protein n=1 Tax=Fonsecaea multimorphosa CBS 102226 TaxID=1442371 RepID=A0A0D2JXT6_9EURO|nr:uncharacterized protein Z520_08841 [Fonsecaea multimorphosa CBS 102226]KIX95324.1 hypothetical protein Z520_08841 [Fonsecaea multimorphosa CBS 102226]OAL21121.1 hypothetical protein AYO22_08278 [Fonsecaea multimorphosa]
MPVYEIRHSYPLSQHQKSLLAAKITELHSTEFLTPSLFVNVHFSPGEPATEFFLAGKPYNNGVTSPNRIMGSVRTGPKRTKERWDAFALRLQEAWYEVVNGPKEQGGRNGVNGHHGEISNEERRARKLHLLGFRPVIGGLENGVLLPSADNEATWLKDNMAFFKEQAEVYDDEPFQGLLKELNERPDLRKLIE